ncbi:hypothetical protein [Streptomyces longwoodensis]|uniref:hypothetical protein n=1 Tax=Streptomyces longwoodensis TaxID=68231 RepID=UPI0033EE50C0
MTALTERPVSLADISRRVRDAVRFAPIGTMTTQRLDTSVRVVRAPGAPSAAHLSLALDGHDYRRLAARTLDNAGYDVTSYGTGLLVHTGTATRSDLFDFVVGWCDTCYYEHDYDPVLSEHLMQVLREITPPCCTDYQEELEAFATSCRNRLRRLHDHIGHEQASHRSGRYVLARQPETWIVLERAATTPDVLYAALEGVTSTQDLSDLTAAWENTG